MNAKATRTNVTPITKAQKGKNAQTLAHGAMPSDAKLADDRHKADRALILDGIDEAESLLGEALVTGLRMTVKYGRTSTEEVAGHYTRCNNPGVYASWFNLGFRAQEIIGQDRALEVIEKAAGEGTGAHFTRARDALRAVIEAARTAGVKQIDGRKGQAVVKAAVQAAADKSVQVKETKKTQRVATRQSATMAAAAMECGKGAREMAAFVKLASQNASRMAAPEGREGAWQTALARLQDAAEAFAIFGK